MKTYILILISIFSLSAMGQTVRFKDPIFKKILLDYFEKIDTNGDGEIQVSEAEAVKRIAIRHDFNIMKVNSFEGLEAFKNLEILGIEGHRTGEDVEKSPLVTIDISTMRNLKSFAFDGFHIKRIDFSKNNKIEEIALRDTSIEDIDVTNAPELQALELRYTKVSYVDASKNKKLVKLFLKEASPNLKVIKTNNGNNHNMWFIAWGNPQLECIQVDSKEIINNPPKLWTAIEQKHLCRTFPCDIPSKNQPNSKEDNSKSEEKKSKPTPKEMTVVSKSNQYRADNHQYVPNQLHQKFFEEIDYSDGKILSFLNDVFGLQGEDAVEEGIDPEKIFTKRFLELNEEYDPYETSKSEEAQIRKKWKGVYDKMITNGTVSLNPICRARFTIESIRPTIIGQKKYKYYYRAIVAMNYIGYNSFDEKKEDPFTGSCYNVVHLVQIDGQYYLDGLDHTFEDYPEL